MMAALLLPACITITTEGSDDPTPAEPSPTGDSSNVIGSGVVETEERRVSGFDSVVLEGIGELHIEFTGEESLSIEAEDNILPMLTSEVSGNELVLAPRSGTGISANEPIVYRLSVAELSSLSVSGSAEVDARGIVGEELQVFTAGASEIRITGSVDRLQVDATGSATFAGRRLQSNNATVEASGSSEVVVNATDSLDVRATGASRVRYSGDPRVSDEVSAAASVRSL